MDNLAPNFQITTEEAIATILFDKYGMDEEAAADASKDIFKLAYEEIESYCTYGVYKHVFKKKE